MVGLVMVSRSLSLSPFVCSLSLSLSRTERQKQKPPPTHTHTHTLGKERERERERERPPTIEPPMRERFCRSPNPNSASSSRSGWHWSICFLSASTSSAPRFQACQFSRFAAWASACQAANPLYNLHNVSSELGWGGNGTHHPTHSTLL